MSKKYTRALIIGLCSGLLTAGFEIYNDTSFLDLFDFWSGVNANTYASLAISGVIFGIGTVILLRRYRLSWFSNIGLIITGAASYLAAAHTPFLLLFTELFLSMPNAVEGEQSFWLAYFAVGSTVGSLVVIIGQALFNRQFREFWFSTSLKMILLPLVAVVIAVLGFGDGDSTPLLLVLHPLWHVGTFMAITQSMTQSDLITR